MPELEAGYTVRAASESDLDTLIELRLYAEKWLLAAGIQQWTDHARGVAAIRAGIHDGTTRVILNEEGEIVASLTLGGPDPDFWTSADELDSALYLYKFMVGEKARGTGLGDALLDWASTQAADQGKKWLRLDCWRTNTGLQSYYANRGFKLLRVVEVPGRNSGALMQRPAVAIQTEMLRDQLA